MPETDKNAQKATVFGQEEAANRPEVVNFRPEANDFRPETTDFRPETDDFGSKVTNFGSKITAKRQNLAAIPRSNISEMPVIAMRYVENDEK